MANMTPLRYPGGKARLFKYFHRLIQQNDLYDCHYVEPFCGGAALAIELLRSQIVGSVHLNDLDRALYAFWHVAAFDTDRLCARISDTPISMDTWYASRDVYRQRNEADLFELAFATFFLNRTNRSGILSAGVIGGLKQEGDWKIDARFNRDDLIERLNYIGRYRHRITVTQLDTRALLQKCAPGFGSNTLIYMDPPYVDKGPRLYLNAYNETDHRELAQEVAELTGNWVVSYDDHPLVRELYDGFQEADMRLHYSAREHTRIGREKVYFSPTLTPPDMEGVKSRSRIPWSDEEPKRSASRRA